MTEREPGEVEVGFSMQNLMDASTLWAIVAPIEISSAVARKAGYVRMDGSPNVEYYPYNVPHAQIRTGVVTSSALNSITSAHQSFRTEKSLKEVINFQPKSKRKIAAQAFVTMPEKFASLEDLEKLQRELGHRLPVIVYPPNEWMGEARPEAFRRLDNKLIQPAPELLDAWGVNTIPEFLDKVKAGGYKLCLDLFHIRRQVTQGFQTQFGRWQDVLPQLLPQTREIHLAVGRNDFQGPFDSAQELKDLYSGERKTEIVPMLETVRDFGWTGPIVTEIPATSAKNLISNSKIATPGMLIKAHSQIVGNIKSIMSRPVPTQS